MKSYVEQFIAALRLFRAKGAVHIDLRTYSGIGHRSLVLEPAALADPPGSQNLTSLVQAVADGFTARISPLTSRGEIPLAFVVWPMKFTLRHRQFVVTDASDGCQRAALTMVLPPSILVAAGGERWAAWRLSQPLSAVEAPAILGRLAERLGGDIVAVQDLTTCTLPLAGRIRNWHEVPAEYISVVALDVQLRYDPAQLELNNVPLSGASDDEGKGNDRKPGEESRHSHERGRGDRRHRA